MTSQTIWARDIYFSIVLIICNMWQHLKSMKKNLFIDLLHLKIFWNFPTSDILVMMNKLPMKSEVKKQ